MAKKLKSIKVSKSILVMITLIVLVVASMIYVSTSQLPEYLLESEKAGQINEYKKALHEALICQNSCPLENQIHENETYLLPAQNCTQICFQEMNSIIEPLALVSDQDLFNDDLAQKTASVFDTCSLQSMQNDKVNYTLYFPCIVENLKLLEQNYTYLN